MIQKSIAYFRQHPIRSGIQLLLLAGGFIAIYFILQFGLALLDPRSDAFLQWWRGDADARAELITVQGEMCAGAPFILPAEGFIGLLYADPRGPYSRTRRHQGIDIFSNAGNGQVPVYAAYDGYITREANWVSTLIQRVPRDPLQPERQIWLYYTHMANASGDTDFIEPAFERGVREVFVEQGTLLGYTGNYSGNPSNPVGVHLHFSIIQDDNGKYTNEADFHNSIDSSPYLGMAVNYGCQLGVATCTTDPVCEEAITP